MNKNILYSLLLGGAMLVSGCEDFTDIQPKGKNLLSSTSELEMLLNYEFYSSIDDYKFMCGDIIGTFSNVPTLIAQPSPTRASLMITWDESRQDKMAELTNSDSNYSEYYGIIGKICNAILSHIDEAEGDEAKKRQLKCEALTLRAYYHYLLVNKFAKAYNPATAQTDGGIAYMTEEADITVNAEQLTVAEVYERILADLDEAISLDGLPGKAINLMRMSKPCAYAAKALALLSMQRFEEAKTAAGQALALNSTVNDYNSAAMTTTVTGYILGNTYTVMERPKLKCEEDYFHTYCLEFYSFVSPESWNAFEKGHASRDRMTTDLMVYDYYMGMGSMFLGLSDYIGTFDLNSSWNGEGMKSTHMYLIIAEAELHAGHIGEAMQALDAIRVNRIDPAVYEPLEGSVSSEADAIAHLKQTAHGENIWSCYNFIWRKRWNQLDGYKQDYTRHINGQVYTLTPESSMWIFPFPVNVMNLNPDMKQNYK